MIVVCGESLMDLFGGSNTSSGLALDARVGGSPFNVAVGLARMGQPVGFLGSISRDFLGDRLVRALVDEGVDTICLARVAQPTTLALVGTDSQGVPSYTFYGEGGADRQLGVDTIERLPAAVSALHLGSFATVVQPIADTLRVLVERLHAGTLISYDPNIRLKVEPELGRWRDTLEWMLPRTHLLKISEEDLALLMPGVGIEAFCRDVLSSGVHLVVVTRGHGGVLAKTSKASAEVPVFAVQVVDTVGAGDTFQAALLAWLAENRCLDIEALGRLDEVQLRRALAFAARAAAITCSRRGADMPRRMEIS
jgi:fructokinase